jgi:hypothetical protein
MTYVLVATDASLDLTTLPSRDGGESLVKSLMLDDEQFQALMTERPAVPLTDQFAPVEQMLAPVFRGETAAK